MLNFLTKKPWLSVAHPISIPCLGIIGILRRTLGGRLNLDIFVRSPLHIKQKIFLSLDRKLNCSLFPFLIWEEGRQWRVLLEPACHLLSYIPLVMITNIYWQGRELCDWSTSNNLQPGKILFLPHHMFVHKRIPGTLGTSVFSGD